MFDFLKERSKDEELMDDFDCQGEVVHQTLRELQAINTYLGGTALSIRGVKKLISKKSQEAYHIVDLGCGGGDTLKSMAKWGMKARKRLKLSGVDANPNIISYAKQNTIGLNIDFQAEDIFSGAFQAQQFDIAHASLFMHHFEEEAFVKLLKQLYDQVSLGIVINDLHRHPISYYFTKWVLTAWSQSEMVRYDSVLSVARSFKRGELERYLQQAGIENYSLKWKWAYRWELIIWK